MGPFLLCLFWNCYPFTSIVFIAVVATVVIVRVHLVDVSLDSALVVEPVACLATVGELVSSRGAADDASQAAGTIAESEAACGEAG